MSKRKKNIQLQNLEVETYVAEGKCIAKHEGKVIFLGGCVPGDVVDVQLTKSKNDWAEARILNFVKYSSNRTEPFCKHFKEDECGGCKWQMLPYNFQTQYKQQQVEDVIKRIGKIKETEFLPIAVCTNTTYYRNKLEFTFSNKKYLPFSALNKDADSNRESNIQNVLGFHAPRLFDKVINIEKCYLQNDISNDIRNSIREFALENNFSFYDIRNHTGLLRNLIVRTTTTNETLINIIFGENNKNQIESTMQFVTNKFPEITSINYTINLKHNDTIYDQDVILYKGKSNIEENLESFKFIISPKSFFQTNTKQAEILYSIARDFAELKGSETLYDLYCGTGSIGIFMSKNAKKIIGVESVADAIEDAKINAKANGLENTHYYTGDVTKICTKDFFEQHGFPDVIITDPPRAGMHQTLVEKLLEIESPKIVYISCNPATQARDIALLSEKYDVVKVQAVDMFPHTHHVESVALLKLKVQ